MEDFVSYIPGMFVEAEIIVEKRKSCSLSNEILISEGGQCFVYVLKGIEPENMVFEKSDVTTGKVTEKMTEIFCYNDSCTVLINGAYGLSERI